MHKIRGEGYGIGFAQESRLANGKRADGFTAFVEPLLQEGKEKRLRVVSMAKVEKVMFNEKKEAESVKVQVDGRTLFLKPRKEIILCAGAYNSPQLLMVSGVGEKEQLESLGIKLVHNNPNVGKNLHDHPIFLHALMLKEEFCQEKDYGGCGIGVNGFYASEWAKKNTPDNGPDMQVLVGANIPQAFASMAAADKTRAWLNKWLGERMPEKGTWQYNVWHNLRLLFAFTNSIFPPPPNKRVVLMGPVLNQPLSRGTLKISSSNIDVPPVIDPVKNSEKKTNIC